ncbi:histidine kinase [Paenibacillaceae bacterium WGS1546]|uniref:histidine kinase n=1 Tax=Cohnella sp. WGS1546 TaxID=3366810 RepID=UPI00372D82F2
MAILRAQIRPHFLFNAFNTIIWMSKRDALSRVHQSVVDETFWTESIMKLGLCIAVSVGERRMHRPNWLWEQRR